ncbi:hypothetical protein M2349_002407 [Caldanaerobacter subterraneus subsp. tengcongensis MB4]|jgi:hypothetical protein|nr:hypothetical protein [Thermoanaerobacter sp.]MCS3917266.1 hypothetical protein [Caldanaerobacter subterraneus subsp. tengcongensis MB4]
MEYLIEGYSIKLGTIIPNCREDLPPVPWPGPCECLGFCWGQVCRPAKELPYYEVRK